MRLCFTAFALHLRHLRIATSIGAAILGSIAAQAAVPARTGCPTGKPLTLTQVQGYIDQKIAEDRTVARIQACHVGFHMDAPTLDRLVRPGVSQKILDALNEVTAAQLTLDQAKTEVAGLQAGIEAGNKSGKNIRPYIDRANYLQQSNYLDSAKATYVSYNPDTQRLVAQIGGEEYWFEKVPPPTAAAVVPAWTQVQAMRPFSDDAQQTRFLVAEALSFSASGSPRKLIEAALHKKIDAMLADADAREARKDFDGALAEYQSASALDPAYTPANEALAKARQTQSIRQAAARQQSEAGVWADPQTYWMWTATDNGIDIGEKEAPAYCTALRWGGFSNWRLPTAAELKTLYDPASTRTTPPVTRTVGIQDHPGAPLEIAFPTQVIPFRAKPQISAAYPIIWASSEGTGKPAGDHVVFDFSAGRTIDLKGLDYHVTNKNGKRVLCVRHAVAGETIVNAPHTIMVPAAKAPKPAFMGDNAVLIFKREMNMCNGGNEYACEEVGISYKDGLGVERDLLKAARYFKLSCDKGNQTSCSFIWDLKQ